MKLVKKYTEVNHSQGKFIKSLTKDDVDNIIEKLNKAIEENPVFLAKYIESETKKWEEIFFKNPNFNLPKPIYVIKLFENEIAEHYSSMYARLLFYPYIIRIKVLDISKSSFENKFESYKQTNIFGKVEDIIKGARRFRVNDEVEFFYLDFWTQNFNISFEKNKSYLVFLSPNSGPDNKYLNNSVGNAESDFGIYCIEEKKIYIPKDDFNYGKVLPWQVFRSKFANDFIKRGVK